MKPFFAILALFLAAMLSGASLCPRVDAQTRKQPRMALGGSSVPEDESAALIKQQSLGLLYKEVYRARLYNQIKDRIIVWCKIADVIWSVDPEKGKQLVSDAYSLVTSAEALEREGETKGSLAMRSSILQQTLRSEVLAVTQKHDPALLQELIKTVKENPRNLSEIHNRPAVFGSSSFQKRALASLAVKLASSEPQRAVDYAIDSLGYGVPEEFGGLFQILIANDRKYAHQLFAGATSVFSNDQSSNLYDAVILSTYLRFIPQPESDVQLVQQFLNSALGRMNYVWKNVQNSQSNDQMSKRALLFACSQLYGFYRLYLPEKVPEVEELIRQTGRTEDAEQQRESEELISKGAGQPDVISILERAEQERNEENRDALYLDASLMLTKEGNYGHALEVAARANNLEKRGAVITYIHGEQVEHLIKQGELFGAAKIIEQIDDPERRVELTVLFARAGSKNDGEFTRSVLEGTRKLLEKNVGSSVHARAYLWLASAYATFEPALSFDLMTSAVKFANKARELNDINAEPKLIQLGGRSRKAVRIGTAKGDFLPGFKLLARKDFASAASIAESFDSQLLRGLSIVAVSEAILAQKGTREK
jgi:hypothetical protein